MSGFCRQFFLTFAVSAFAFFLSADSVTAQTKSSGISKGTEMRVAGRQTFSVKNKQKAQNILWRIDREETDEKGGAPILTKNVMQKTGATVTVDLPKIAGKETVYRVTASGKDFEDSQKIRVFEAGVPSSFDYQSAGNPPVHTFVVAPEKINAKTRIIIILSGLNRNADEYVDSWKDWARRNNYVAVSPTFDEENWGGSRGYNFGNVFAEDEGKGNLNPESKWSFAVVEGIYQTVRDGFGVKDRQFDIFGHSAGAQFIHRFLLFRPQAPVRYSIAANAGWYTLPDLNTDFPYGVRHPLLNFTERQMRGWTNRRMVIMRGANDVSREGVLRKTPEADAQGQNRFERAEFMFKKAREFNSQTKWELIDVPGVGHDQRKMARAAQKVLDEKLLK